MPPRIPVRCAALHQSSCNPISSSIPTFLLPFLSPPTSQCRYASILTDLRDTPGAYNKAIRRGRGPSSGKGKTSGRGQKGQKAKGNVPQQLTGGQTPDHVVHGHYGFKNVHAEEMSPINLDTIQSWIDTGRLKSHRPITLRELCASRALHGIKDGVKLLARGSTALTTPIHIVVSRASKSAIAAVEALGGSVVTRYYTPQAIRRIKAGEMHPYVSMQWDQAQLAKPAFTVRGADSPEQRVKGVGYNYRLPDPVSRKDLEYYRDENNRGYLSHQVAEGHSASLWYESAPEAAERKARIAADRAARGTTSGGRTTLGRDNKMW